jgi:hypothetical protein
VNVSGALEVVLGNGTRIRTTAAPGSVIPPGPYLLIVNTDVPEPRDSFHIFHLSGPGVNMSSDLLPCENPREIYDVTLRPNSTYVYEDTRHPDTPRVVFSTAATGSSADTSGASSGPGYVTSSGTVSNQSVIGTNAFRGTLTGTVAAGKLNLSRNGKPVSTLKTGRYRIAVDDRTASGGFALRRPKGDTVQLTAPAFVGKRSTTLTLRPGRWAYSSPTATRTFTVVT